jgi:hypothetical protein
MKLLLALLLALAATLSGCVVAPYDSGYYGSGPYYGGYYGGPPLVIEGSYGHGGYYHHRRWR